MSFPIISYSPKYIYQSPNPMTDFQYVETCVPTLKALGGTVRNKRRASALRIDDAAALCGVSVDLLSRLENGKSGISTDRLLRVLDGLGLAMLVIDKEKAERALRTVAEPDR